MQTQEYFDSSSYKTMNVQCRHNNTSIRLHTRLWMYNADTTILRFVFIQYYECTMQTQQYFDSSSYKTMNVQCRHNNTSIHLHTRLWMYNADTTILRFIFIQDYECTMQTQQYFDSSSYKTMNVQCRHNNTSIHLHTRLWMYNADTTILRFVFIQDYECTMQTQQYFDSSSYKTMNVQCRHKNTSIRLHTRLWMYNADTRILQFVFIQDYECTMQTHEYFDSSPYKTTNVQCRHNNTSIRLHTRLWMYNADIRILQFVFIQDYECTMQTQQYFNSSSYKTMNVQGRHKNTSIHLHTRLWMYNADTRILQFIFIQDYECTMQTQQYFNSSSYKTMNVQCRHKNTSIHLHTRLWMYNADTRILQFIFIQDYECTMQTQEYFNSSSYKTMNVQCRHKNTSIRLHTRLWLYNADTRILQFVFIQDYECTMQTQEYFNSSSYKTMNVQCRHKNTSIRLHTRLWMYNADTTILQFIFIQDYECTMQTQQYFDSSSYKTMNVQCRHNNTSIHLDTRLWMYNADIRILQFVFIQDYECKMQTQEYFDSSSYKTMNVQCRHKNTSIRLHTRLWMYNADTRILQFVFIQDYECTMQTHEYFDSSPYKTTNVQCRHNNTSIRLHTRLWMYNADIRILQFVFIQDYECTMQTQQYFNSSSYKTMNVQGRHKNTSIHLHTRLWMYNADTRILQFIFIQDYECTMQTQQYFNSSSYKTMNVQCRHKNTSIHLHTRLWMYNADTRILQFIFIQDYECTMQTQEYFNSSSYKTMNVQCRHKNTSIRLHTRLWLYNADTRILQFVFIQDYECTMQTQEYFNSSSYKTMNVQCRHKNTSIRLHTRLWMYNADTTILQFIFIQDYECTMQTQQYFDSSSYKTMNVQCRHNNTSIHLDTRLWMYNADIRILQFVFIQDYECKMQTQEYFDSSSYKTMNVQCRHKNTSIRLHTRLWMYNADTRILQFVFIQHYECTMQTQEYFDSSSYKTMNVQCRHKNTSIRLHTRLWMYSADTRILRFVFIQGYECTMQTQEYFNSSSYKTMNVQCRHKNTSISTWQNIEFLFSFTDSRSDLHFT